MKKIYLLFAVLCTSSLVHAQNKFIEVGVNDVFALEPVQAIVHIHVESVVYQIEMNTNPVEQDEGYEFDGAYPGEYEYFGDEPGKLSKKEYKQREAAYIKAVAEYQLEVEAANEARQREYSERRQNFRAFSVKNTMETLKSAGLTYSIDTNAVRQYENWQLNYYADTQLVVLVNSSVEFDALMNLFEQNRAVSASVREVEYANPEAKYEEILPKLSERARVQAEILAKSMNKKLGDIQQISNVYPGISPGLIAMQSNPFERNYLSLMEENMLLNPFAYPRNVPVEFIFRFDILK